MIRTIHRDSNHIDSPWVEEWYDEKMSSWIIHACIPFHGENMGLHMSCRQPRDIPEWFRDSIAERMLRDLKERSKCYTD